MEPIILNEDNPAEVKEKTSELLKKPIESDFDHGRLIFPNQVVTADYAVVIPTTRLTSAFEKSRFRNRDGSLIKGLGIELFVCFGYQSILDPSKHHQTQNLYMMVHRSKESGGAASGLFLAAHRIYEASAIELIYKGMGAYAD